MADQERWARDGVDENPYPTTSTITNCAATPLPRGHDLDGDAGAVEIWDGGVVSCRINGLEPLSNLVRR